MLDDLTPFTLLIIVQSVYISYSGFLAFTVIREINSIAWLLPPCIIVLFCLFTPGTHHNT